MHARQRQRQRLDGQLIAASVACDVLQRQNVTHDHLLTIVLLKVWRRLEPHRSVLHKLRVEIAHALLFRINTARTRPFVSPHPGSYQRKLSCMRCQPVVVAVQIPLAV